MAAKDKTTIDDKDELPTGDEAQPVISDSDDESQVLRAPTPTHEDLLALDEMEKRERDVEDIVQERAKDRPILKGYPPPQTSSYLYVPGHFWTEHTSEDDPTTDTTHKGHAVQVAQVHTYDDSPAMVTLRCDCGREVTVPWTRENAEQVYNVDEDTIRAEIREDPRPEDERGSLRRSDGDTSESDQSAR